MQEEKPNLPLRGEKKVPVFKIIALLSVIALFMLVNFIFSANSRHEEKPVEEDSYNLPSIKAEKNSQAPKQPSIDVSAQLDAKEQLRKNIEAARAQEFLARMQASQSNGNITSAPSISSPRSDAQAANETAKITDPNSAFLASASNSKAEHVYATHFGNLPYIVGQGKFIFGQLAVAINSDLPGQIVAIVSQDIYGEQGRKILIPRGSILIGEYKSGLVNNQSRVFVVWTRLRLPNGIDVQIGSPGTDALGQAGLTGAIDNHYLARFGSASLIAMIGAGAANVGVSSQDQYNSAAAYRQSLAQAFSTQASNVLDKNIEIPPTIHVPQGTKIVVFVNRDLDFSRVYR